MNTAQNKLRMKAEDLGGNYVLMDMVVGDVNGVSISGRALACPESTRSQGAAPAAIAATAQPTDKTSGDEVTTTAQATPESKSSRERLAELDQLKADGLITEEEYAQKRQKILQDL